MKLIFKIARTELRNLFYSPIAWFLTIAFLVQCGVAYIGALNRIARTQEMGGAAMQYVNQLTLRVFVSSGGVFSSAMQNLYLYIPLLTMGLISREINGGTISLLYSSPVKVREIVLGKYLAMMVYSLLLVAVVALFMISAIFHIEFAETGILWSAALGFYLLLCAYSAIGLFMSCLTSYQVVAAVSTFVMIGILTYIGGLWQSIDFVRDLTYFLSINGRTGKMLIGLITTKDVIYFLIIVYIFLSLSIYKLKNGKESKPAIVKAGRYAFIVASALIIGYISSRPGFIYYWDTTPNKDNTLAVNTQKIIKELGDDPLEITVYNNLLDNHYFLGLPEQRNAYLEKWESYLRFKPDITFKYVNYYDTTYDPGHDMFRFYPGKTFLQIAEQKAKSSDVSLSMFQTPAEIRKQIDLRPELNRFVMQLKYKGKSTFLRVFNDMLIWPGETEVSAAFKRLLQAQMPKIYFLTNNGERDVNKKGDREYQSITSLKTFRYALINQGFDVDTLSLESRNMPDDITALVIADPRVAFNPDITIKIQQYINKGGNLVIAGEPGRQSLLNPLLKQLGVQLMDGMLEQKSNDFAPSLVLPSLTKAATRFANFLDKSSVYTLPVSMTGVAGLSFMDTLGFAVQPLLLTDAGRSWNSSDRNPDLDQVSQNEEAVHAIPVRQNMNRAAPAESARIAPKPLVKNSGLVVNAGIRRSYPTALALTRKIGSKEQRIIITGDADFMSNSELGRSNVRTSNFPFSIALFSWLDNGQFPIDASRPDAKDNRVTVTLGEIGVLKLFYVWVLPAILLLFGAILLIRRNRK